MNRDQGMFPEQRFIKWVYVVTLFMMGLTGFAQMPIFKRYYIADIPGLGWLADFYFTHYLHYIGAMVLFILFAYCITAYMMVGKHSFKLTRAAYWRIFLLACIVITGIFRVLKNLPDIVFSTNFTMFIDISHLGFMMIFMAAGIVFLIRKRGWVERDA
jgi:hypothetical protein